MELSRRDFLKAGTLLAAGFGLGSETASVFAAGMEGIARGQVRVLWLQGQSCSGCSVSLLNSAGPTPVELLTQTISLVFHSTLSATQGHQVGEVIEKVQGAGPFILALEGSIPVDVPTACTFNGRPLAAQLPGIIRRAQAVVAVGTCAAFGGIPAAEGNPTGAISVQEFMKREGLQVPLVNLPSCPAHPKSMAGTLAYVAAKGVPEIHPELKTPTMFYGHRLHDECPRFHYWEKYEFATHFGDHEGCLFKLGCLGPHSYTQCSSRQWNGGVNWCIRAGAPCIGCSSPRFAYAKDFPFYRKSEHVGDSAAPGAQREGADG